VRQILGRQQLRAFVVAEKAHVRYSRIMLVPSPAG
jgi:hypothetical protein